MILLLLKTIFVVLKTILKPFAWIFNKLIIELGIINNLFKSEKNKAFIRTKQRNKFKSMFNKDNEIY